MKQYFFSGLLFFCAAGLWSCGTTKQGHPTPAARDLTGVYTANLPCADCEGIQTMMMLNPDGHFEREMNYLGKPAKPFRDSGTYKMVQGKLVLNSSEKDAPPSLFIPAGRRLTQLDGAGKVIRGALASHFIFTRQDFPLLEQYWKLIAINGQPVPARAGKEPHLVFKAFDNRVHGNAGCNSFFGSYAWDGSRGLKFSGMGATKMACPNLETEDRLLQTLGAVSRFSLRGDTLTMTGENSSGSLQWIRPAAH